MERLQYLASLTKGLDSVVDCGCDHAYTLIKAIKNYGVKKGLGLDINDGPLEAAKKNVLENNLNDSIEIVKSDGLTNYTKDYEGLIISGMGGSLIEEILDYDVDTTRTSKRLILSPHNDTYKVRFWLINNNFRIVDEQMIEDQNHIYEVIVATNEPLNRKYDYFDLRFGPILRVKKGDLFKKKYQAQLAQVIVALETATDKTQIARLQMTRAMLEDLLK